MATPAPAVDAGGLNARAGKLAAAQADLVRARAQTTRLFDVKVGIRARVAELVARLSTPGKAFPEDAASLVLARKNLEQIDDHFRVALGRQQTALHVRDALIFTGPI